jgi:hypothetical protein
LGHTRSWEEAIGRPPWDADRVVIMVDPFQELLPLNQPDYPIEKPRQDDLNIGYVARNMLGAVMSQSRFKATALDAAMDLESYSRYMIVPTKERGLACELLGAFGGFLDHQFRENDFQIGRRNCREFLAKHLVVGAKSPLRPAYDEAYTSDPSRLPHRPPLVPLLGSAAERIKLPPWATMPHRNLQMLRGQLTDRAKLMVGNAIRHLPWRMRMLARLTWRLSRSEIIGVIMKNIEGELSRTGQLER